MAAKGAATPVAEVETVEGWDWYCPSRCCRRQNCRHRCYRCRSCQRQRCCRCRSCRRSCCRSPLFRLVDRPALRSPRLAGSSRPRDYRGRAYCCSAGCWFPLNRSSSPKPARRHPIHSTRLARRRPTRSTRLAQWHSTRSMRPARRCSSRSIWSAGRHSLRCWQCRSLHSRPNSQRC